VNGPATRTFLLSEYGLSYRYRADLFLPRDRPLPPIDVERLGGVGLFRVNLTRSEVEPLTRWFQHHLPLGPRMASICALGTMDLVTRNAVSL
jgi:hypothetical protein